MAVAQKEPLFQPGQTIAREINESLLCINYRVMSRDVPGA